MCGWAFSLALCEGAEIYRVMRVCACAMLSAKKKKADDDDRR